MRRGRFSELLLVGYIGLGSLIAAGTAFAADGYTPPSSPELYDKEPVEGPVAKIRSKVYGGFNLGIGQSQSAAQGGPKAAYIMGPKLGYNKTLSTWSLLDVDASLLTGEVGYSKANMHVNYGLMFRIGYGYSLGNHVFGIWKLGVGLCNADYTWNFNGFKRKGLMGTVFQGAFELLFPVSTAVAITGAAQWNRYVLDVGDVSNGPTSLAINQTERLNVWLADVGVRLYF